MMEERSRYWAFISYSHTDTRWADWLHRHLEGFHIPSRLRSLLPKGVPCSERLAPVFTDRAELAAAHSLTEAILTALDESHFLIVIASPASARSMQVAAEIAYFRQRKDSRRILTFIVGGRPNAALRGFPESEECFPEALREDVSSEAIKAATPGPLAADARGGARQRRAALWRLVGGLLGVSYDALLQRDNRRRTIRVIAAVCSSVVVLAAVAALASGWRIGPRGFVAPPPDPVAVQLDAAAFRDHSPAHDFLGAAVDAELQRALSGIVGLRVEHPSPHRESLADIELQCALSDRDDILTLSVRATEKRSWTTSRRPFEFTLRRPLVRWYELATGAAATIATHLELDVPEVTAHGAPRPVDAEALSLYTEGRYLWLRNTARDLGGARSALRDSISIDPTFAPAWAALSRVYANQADSHLVDQDVAYQDARVAAVRAIALDPNLAAGHVALSHVYWCADWDWSGTEYEIREALRLNPRSAETLHIAGDLAKTLGRWDDAIELFARARELDPLQPSASAVAGPLACAGRVEEAEQEWRRVARLDPGVGGAHYGLARLYVAMGRPAEALEALNAEPEETWRRIMTPTVLYAARRRSEADKALADLERRATEDSAAVYIAEAYVAAGDRNAAIQWLQKAFDGHDSNLSFVKADALLAQISDDPRYRRILAAMKLPLDGQCVIRPAAGLGR